MSAAHINDDTMPSIVAHAGTGVNTPSSPASSAASSLNLTPPESVVFDDDSCVIIGGEYFDLDACGDEAKDNIKDKLAEHHGEGEVKEERKIVLVICGGGAKAGGLTFMFPAEQIKEHWGKQRWVMPISISHAHANANAGHLVSLLLDDQEEEVDFTSYSFKELNSAASIAGDLCLRRIQAEIKPHMLAKLAQAAPAMFVDASKQGNVWRMVDAIRYLGSTDKSAEILALVEVGNAFFVRMLAAAVEVTVGGGDGESVDWEAVADAFEDGLEALGEDDD